MQYLFTSKYQVRHSFQISNPSSSLVESFQYCVHFLLQEWISYFSGHFWWSSEVVREAFLKLYQPGSVLQLSVKPQKGYIFDWYFFSTTTCTCIFLFIFILQITYWYVGWFVYAMKKGTNKAGQLCSLPQENSPGHRQLKSCYLPQWYTLTVLKYFFLWNIFMPLTGSTFVLSCLSVVNSCMKQKTIVFIRRPSLMLGICSKCYRYVQN